MEKVICEAKLNALIANAKAFKALCEAEELNPDKVREMTVETGIHLCRLTAREPLFKHKPGNPFYAFVKHVGTVVTVVVDVQSGSVLVVDNDVISSQTEVNGDFTIKGVTYKLKDKVSGFKRYCVAPRASKRYNRGRKKALAVREAREQWQENEGEWIDDADLLDPDQSFDITDLF